MWPLLQWPQAMASSPLGEMPHMTIAILIPATITGSLMAQTPIITHTAVIITKVPFGPHSLAQTKTFSVSDAATEATRHPSAGPITQVHVMSSVLGIPKSYSIARGDR